LGVVLRGVQKVVVAHWFLSENRVPLGFSWFSQLKHGIPAYPQTDPCITYVFPKYLHGIMQNQLFAGPKPVILGLGLLFHS